MSLLNCPECNREISDRAVNCPHCGFPLSSQASQKTAVSSWVQVDEKSVLLCTFEGTKSIATPIVSAVILEFIIGVFAWNGIVYGGYATIFLIFAIFLEISIPFLIIHDIKEINRVNRANGCKLYHGMQKNIIYIRGKDNNILFKQQLAKIVDFKGYGILRIIYNDNANVPQKFIAGCTDRETVLKLRELIEK